MIYGYIRVSTHNQDVENQIYELKKFETQKGLKIDKWIQETISGTKHYKNRELGVILKSSTKDDIIICSELSRLGRTLFMIMDILNMCIEKGIKVLTIKDNYNLDDSIQSKVIAFAFGLSAEIERQLISQRTKEALAKLKENGVILGRPKGKSTCLEKNKCYPCRHKILTMLRNGKSFSQISKKVKIYRTTISKFTKQFLSNEPI